VLWVEIKSERKRRFGLIVGGVGVARAEEMEGGGLLKAVLPVCMFIVCDGKTSTFIEKGKEICAINRWASVALAGQARSGRLTPYSIYALPIHVCAAMYLVQRSQDQI
jgi:hypothetical protein